MPKRMQVLRRFIYVSEMNPPTTVSKKVVPMKFVVVVEAPGESKCITNKKYNTKLAMFATNPMLSSNIIATIET
jgi:hypothetical protein